MSIPLITGANHMQVLEDWQAMISHNLANASTPGFQKGGFEIEGIRKAPLAATEGSGQSQAMFPSGKALRMFSAGEIRNTGNPYDFAIQGDGFFSVQGPGGQTMYTRDGEFHLSAEGIIVNKMGHAVLSEGSPIEITLTEGPISVAKDGTISQNGQNIGRISVYAVNNPNNLAQGNGSYFFDIGGQGGVELVESPTIAQGQIETSNVRPLQEMVSMITVSRAYEITQKMMEADEERATQAIQTFSV